MRTTRPLGRALDRRGIDIETITAAVSAFAVAQPTWAVGSGGTRLRPLPDGRASRATSSTSLRIAQW